MLKGKLSFVGVLVALVSVLAWACTAATPTPTATPRPTATPTPVPTPTPTPKPLFPLSITDSSGQQVTLQKLPERIIAFDSAAVEILFALGEGRRVVGTHRFVSYPPEVKDIAKVGDAFNLDVEKSVALQPDLFFVFFERFVPDLKKAGLNVLYIKSPETLEGVKDYITLWGRIVDREAKAKELVKELQARLDAAKAKLPKTGTGPRVLHEVGDLWTTGNDTFVGSLYVFLKADNVAKDIKGWQQMSAEKIVERDPEVIVTTSQARQEAIKGAPAFSKLTAVKNNRVYTVDSSLISIPGPRIVQAVEELARLLYPD